MQTTNISWLGLLLLCVILSLSGCADLENARYDMMGPPKHPAILIDLTNQEAVLYSRGAPVLTSQVSTGREGYNTPAGRYSVIEKDIGHRSSIYGAYMRDGYIVKENVNVNKDPRPPGSKFVGASMPYFLRIVGGVGLHAGYLPGYPASHGCIRMPESKAKRFYAAAHVGTPVTVRR